MRNLEHAAVVVTGASSGIGRATALELARRGAHVVAAARDADALEALAADCRAMAGAAMAIPLDVADPGAVQQLARRTVDVFGRLDAWVNNAGVTTYGTITDIPLAEWRRVHDVTYFGVVHGLRAALPWMCDQGYGVIVNNASVFGYLAAPYLAPYVAAKHAVRAVSMSARQELRSQGNRTVHVCCVLPSTIDTPLFARAGNHTGHAVRAMPPVYTARTVARTIVACVRRPRAEATVGLFGRLGILQQRLVPRAGERIVGTYVERMHVDRRRTEPATSGNLFAPVDGDTETDGGWNGDGRSHVRRALGAAAAVGAGAGAAAAWRSRQR